MAAGIPWSSIKALSFDIYGTLIDWEKGITAAARATLLGAYLPASDRELLLGIEKHDTAVQRESPTMRQSAVIAEGLRRYAVDDLGVIQKGQVSEQEVKEAVLQYGDQIGHYPVFADTVEAIQRLGQHYKLIPLSNVDRVSFAKTLAGPLRGCAFDAYYLAEDIGSYKPDLNNFHYLLQHLKQDYSIDKAQLCHVAQSLFHDHRPAKELDIRSVWVDRQGIMGGETQEAQEKYGYQLRVDSLGELAEIVQQAFKTS